MPKAPLTKQDQEEAALKVIFQEESGKMPDLSKLERHRSSMIIWIAGAISAILLCILAAIWVGFVVFKPFHGFQGQALALMVDGPEQVTLGQEMTYFINYHNDSTGPIAAAELRASFPPDFSVTHLDTPPTGEGFVWRIGSIPSGEHGTIKVQGVFLGALGTETAIQVVGTYRPGSFNSDFEQLAMRTLKYSESVVDGSMFVPEKILPGDKVRMTYNLHNRGTDELTQLEARITLPSGFVRETTSTNALLDESVARIPVGSLAPDASTTVSIIGMFASGASGDVPIHAEVGRVGSNNIFQAIQKTDAVASVLAGDLLLHLVVNGSESNRSVSALESLHFALAYENTSPEEIKDVVFRFIVEPATTTQTTTPPNKKVPLPVFVDWSQLDDSASGTVSGNTLTWNKDQLGELERLPSQTDGTIEFSVPVASYASGTSDVPFQVSVQATMASVGKTVINRAIKTKPIIFRVRSDAAVTTEARYFSEEGAQMGSGPLPPVAGQATTYRIQWVLKKTLHELTGIRVSAVLPKNVEWPNNATVEAGDISYDTGSRAVTWTLNRMPADINELTADFDLQLTPAEADIGRFADLFGETRFEATDALLSEGIVRVKSALNTDLKTDEGAKSKGVVKRP